MEASTRWNESPVTLLLPAHHWRDLAAYVRKHAPRPPSHEAEATLNRWIRSSGELPTYKPLTVLGRSQFDPELDLRQDGPSQG